MRQIWRHWWVKVIAILMVVLLLFFGTPLGSYAVSFFQKTVAGMGQMTYTDEVGITDIKVKSLSKVTVTLESKASTVADRDYSAYLYLDDVKQAVPQPVSWDAGDIPSVKKKVTFDGLDLAATTVVDVEVTY